MKDCLARYLGRRWLAPEIVQTSAMDCGPAALKCLLEGHGVAASYGRLREACQTGVDGTSIDAIEEVAGQLGIAAEQVIVPQDFIGLDPARSLPALVVVRHAEQFTHFVVVWARHGDWLQVMDPAVGRRWVSCRRFAGEIFTHEQSADARDWRAWCASEDFTAALRSRLAGLGAGEGVAEALLAEALADAGWFGCGALDASVRLAAALVAAGGLKRGEEAARTVAALFRDTCASTSHIFAVIPRAYWSAIPDIANTDPSREMLLISGGVMLRTMGVTASAAPTEQLAPELAAALGADAQGPLRRCWALLRGDRGFRPGLVGAMVALQAGAVLLQAVLLRGLVELVQELGVTGQRLGVLAALLVLAGAAGLIDVALARTAIALGRRLEARLRQALLARLPRLDDRYFQSRPITDMADRSHMIHAVRALPPLAVQAAQAVAGLLLTLLAVCVLAPDCTGPALLVAVAGIGLPLALQPLLSERDLRLRNHGAALHGFTLDTLLGIAPIRAHRAQAAIARQHEALLVDWLRAGRGLARWSLAAEVVPGLVGTALVGWMLARHLLAQPAVLGTDLLLVFWGLRLPALAGAVAGAVRGWSPIRNAVLRQLEPLDAPVIEGDAAEENTAPAQGPVALAIRGGTVVAGGHAVLRDIELAIAPGEHVAIVGKSGAGKSSLLGLLLGWHRLAEGSLAVDGAPLTVQRLEALRQRTAWVDPQVRLWNRSLFDNIAYAGDDGDLAAMPAVIAAADLAGVASRLPHGLQTPLGEGGGLLSGGEGQRVRLARAQLTGDPRLVLLDEPFRGLDRGQRTAMLAGARRWWAGTTLLCVSHDISDTADFPRVLVVEDGRVVEDGAPAELAMRNSRYRALLDAESQLRARRWGAAAWRRWRIAGGRIDDDAVVA